MKNGPDLKPLVMRFGKGGTAMKKRKEGPTKPVGLLLAEPVTSDESVPF